MYGAGNSYTAEFWQYDPRLGRRWNCDPVIFPWESLYAAFRNNPITLNDVKGNCPDCDKQFPDAKAGDVFRPDGAKHDYTKQNDGSWIMNGGELNTFEIVEKKSSISNSFGEIIKLGNKFNWSIGTSASILELKGGFNSVNMYSQGVRKGVYGNYQLTGRNLNLFKDAKMTEATRPVSAVGRWGGILGKATFGVGLGVDAIGVGIYIKAPTSVYAVHPAKMGLNTAMGYISLKFNPVAGALYFGVDAFYPEGWKGYATDYDRLQKANEAIVPGFITAPYGALKQ